MLELAEVPIYFADYTRKSPQMSRIAKIYCPPLLYRYVPMFAFVFARPEKRPTNPATELVYARGDNALLIQNTSRAPETMYIGAQPRRSQPRYKLSQGPKAFQISSRFAIQYSFLADTQASQYPAASHFIPASLSNPPMGSFIDEMKTPDEIT